MVTLVMLLNCAFGRVQLWCWKTLKAGIGRLHRILFSVALGDVDSDGHVEIVTGGDTIGRLVICSVVCLVWRNLGTGEG